MKKTSKPLSKKFKRKWITALRSGKYEQTQCTLKSKNHHSYCCLGVACRVAGVPANVLVDKDVPWSLGPISLKRLPPFFREHSDEMDKLTILNDGELKSFDEIADYIEKYL